MVEVSRERLETFARVSGIPDHMIEGLVQYVMVGRPVGHFLRAVLSNDLKEACNRADELNQHKLYGYVFFLYNYCPIGCWGSSGSYVEWVKHRGMLFETGPKHEDQEQGPVDA